MNPHDIPTPKPHDEFDKILEFILGLRDKWICIRCGQPIELEIQVGRSVEGYPCGCHLWQGTARGRKPVELRGPKGGL